MSTDTLAAPAGEPMTPAKSFQGLRRMFDWQETAAQSLSLSFGVPMRDARKALDNMFTIIEDVQYLVLVDCHDVPDGMTEYGHRSYTEEYDGYEDEQY